MMMTLKFGRCAGLAVLLAGFLSACGNKENQAPSGGGSSSSAGASEHPLPTPPAVAECEPGTPGGRIVIAAFVPPKTFNPLTANEVSSTDIILRMFSGLVNVDPPTENVRPGLAESWSVEPDNKTWTFHLRTGVRWSDGAPLTADDVVFTWDVIYNPDIVNVTRDQFIIDGKKFTISKVDDYTIKVVTPEIYAPFLEFFGSVPIIPKHVLAKAVEEKRFQAAYGVDANPADVVC
ncbi:MAG TPA: ABC transporter substrate-binding protein, partial [Verrucomicrobiae bacterium]|nr:ABC transporter substrate-binding protein [Verrucomicrobiae bacterium]